MDDEFLKLLRETNEKIMREGLGLGTYNNSLLQPTSPTKSDIQAMLRNMAAKYQSPILLGDIYLVGRAGDTALLRRAIERVEQTRIYEGRWEDGPESLVIITSSIGKQIIKVYLESPEQTFAKWEAAGESLTQLIERLKIANQDK